MDVAAALRRLTDESVHARPDDLPRLVDAVTGDLGARKISIYLADLRQQALILLDSHYDEKQSPDEIAIDGSLGGRAYRLGEPQHGPGDDAAYWLPLSNGAERLGVLKVVSDRDDVAAYEELARHVAMILAARRAAGDLIERVRRREQMLVPAELIRSQLPPLAFATARTVFSGVLEPCYAVGGDAFDYAVNGDTVHLALFDAVGHGAHSGGLRAAVLASVALAAYRNARRSGFDLADTYRHVDRQVSGHDSSGLITGVFAEFDERTGVLRVISAGHPGGIVLRGGAAVAVLPTPTALPVTMGDLQAPMEIEQALSPGDHVLLYTDGITEARSDAGDLFGEERLADFMIQALADGLPLTETTRRLIALVMEHQNDILQDDATVLLLRWLG
jgi:serine phosphatase RsbU (regulator of sigma subunit)